MSAITFNVVESLDGYPLFYNCIGGKCAFAFNIKINNFLSFESRVCSCKREKESKDSSGADLCVTQLDDTFLKKGEKIGEKIKTYSNNKERAVLFEENKKQQITASMVSRIASFARRISCEQALWLVPLSADEREEETVSEGKREGREDSYNYRKSVSKGEHKDINTSCDTQIAETTTSERKKYKNATNMDYENQKLCSKDRLNLNMKKEKNISYNNCLIAEIKEVVNTKTKELGTDLREPRFSDSNHSHIKNTDDIYLFLLHEKFINDLSEIKKKAETSDRSQISEKDIRLTLVKSSKGKPQCSSAKDNSNVSFFKNPTNEKLNALCPSALERDVTTFICGQDVCMASGFVSTSAEKHLNEVQNSTVRCCETDYACALSFVARSGKSSYTLVTFVFIQPRFFNSKDLCDDNKALLCQVGNSSLTPATSSFAPRKMESMRTARENNEAECLLKNVSASLDGASRFNYPKQANQTLSISCMDGQAGSFSGLALTLSLLNPAGFSVLTAVQVGTVSRRPVPLSAIVRSHLRTLQTPLHRFFYESEMGSVHTCVRKGEYSHNYNFSPPQRVYCKTTDTQYVALDRILSKKTQGALLKLREMLRKRIKPLRRQELAALSVKREQMCKEMQLTGRNCTIGVCKADTTERISTESAAENSNRQRLNYRDIKDDIRVEFLGQSESSVQVHNTSAPLLPFDKTFTAFLRPFVFFKSFPLIASYFDLNNHVNMNVYVMLSLEGLCTSLFSEIRVEQDIASFRIEYRKEIRKSESGGDTGRIVIWYIIDKIHNKDEDEEGSKMRGFEIKNKGKYFIAKFIVKAQLQDSFYKGANEEFNAAWGEIVFRAPKEQFFHAHL